VTPIDRKALIREYKQTPRPAGIFRVHNTKADISLLGSTPDLPGMLNRQRFQLEMGSHPSKQLQADWNELGPDAFAFEVLDHLEPSDEPGYDPSDDLGALKAMWIEKLSTAGHALYPELGRGGQ